MSGLDVCLVRSVLASAGRLSLCVAVLVFDLLHMPNSHSKNVENCHIGCLGCPGGWVTGLVIEQEPTYALQKEKSLDPGL